MVTEDYVSFETAKLLKEGIEGWQREKLIARHFYELGLRARKED